MLKNYLTKTIEYLSSLSIMGLYFGGSSPAQNALDENAEFPLVNPRGMDRKHKLLAFISPQDQEGLEIGPLCWPLVTKSESEGKIYYVDYSTAEFLREKYKENSKVIIDEIVETDYLWGKQTLPELVDGKLFDYVVASHVIEHVPNMLGWLREIGAVLKDGGILSLAIPDKRYTFDIKRELTSLGDLIESYLHDRRRPNPRVIFEHTSLACKVDMVLAWNNGIILDDLEHMGDLDKAYELASKYFTNEDYQDVHVNILTPQRFLMLIEGASKLGLFDYEIASFYDTHYNSHEFIVSLRRLPRELSEDEKISRQIPNISHVRKQLSVSGADMLIATSPIEIQYDPNVEEYAIALSMMNIGSVAGRKLKFRSECDLPGVEISIKETNPKTGEVIGSDLVPLLEVGKSCTMLVKVSFGKRVQQNTKISLQVLEGFGNLVGMYQIPVYFG